MTETPLARSRDLTRLRPRAGIAALVAAHFLLAIAQTWMFPAQLLNRVNGELAEALADAQETIPQGQIALIAAYMMLGGGGWVGRIIRGILLLLWLELGHMIGTLWLAGGRDVTGFMFFLGTNVWHLVFYLLPLLAYRAITWRRLVLPSAATPARFQFRIWHLLLVTTEAAVLLALLRFFLANNRDWPDDLWTAIRIYLWEYASYDWIALVILSTVPTILITLRWRSIRRGGAALAIWQVLLATGFLIYRVLLPELDPQFPITPLSPLPAWTWFPLWLKIASACLGMTLVLWPTLVAVRWLGYEFVPPQRGRRQSPSR